MAISDVFSIGVSALNAQRKVLEVTSENISNVNTPGYSKQTAVLEPGMANLENRFMIGSGVQVATVQRVYDDFLQKQLVSANSQSGNYNTQQTSMNSVQQLFNEFSSAGLGTDITSFFNAWQDLSDNPSGQAERQAVLAQGTTLVDDFHQMSTSLNQVKNDANQTLQGLTSDINDDLNQIASLNDQIHTIQFQGGDANEQLDSRDQLVRDLAEKIGITCQNNADGTINVTLPQGATLVSGNQAATLSLQANPANSGYFNVMLTSPGSSTANDITQSLVRADGNQGEIGATLQVRDSLVNNSLNGLDELAYNIATQVNNLHSSGYSLNGATGTDFFTAPPVPTPPATYPSGYSGTIDLNITNINDIAAATSNPTTTGGTGDNGNALSIAGLASQLVPMSTGNMTLSGYYNSLVGNAGVAAQSAQRGATQSSASINQLEQMRDSQSGVSLDEELSNLITYQKSYEGAAKLITTGTDMLDTVLGLVGTSTA
ncbi:MAG TPA: flagellar hook-associated protein FlgK [Geobacteraceae bacterium]|nr:flagellar hook-associated protein FlgK [Geobacteraceae bacterium]